jgi:sec-independent protein translocase protein TatA
MDFFSLPHLIVVAVIVVVLFGAGRLPRVMGDFAKGIKEFKAGLKDVESDAAAPAEASRSQGPVAPAIGPSRADQPTEHV